MTDSYVRGAQPTKEGFAALQKNLGIKTVINLRAFSSDRKKIAKTPMDYEHIWFKTWHPEEEDVVKYLSIATDPQRQPVFVHCRYGCGVPLC